MNILKGLSELTPGGRFGALKTLLILALLSALGLPPAVRPAQAGEPMAEVDGVAITVEEVEGAIAPQLNRLEEQIYNLKRQKVEALIGARLLAREAAKRGISVAALLDAEVTSKVALVTEEEIESFYQARKSRLQGDETTVRAQIRAQLQNQKLAARRDAFLGILRAQAHVVVHLPPPPVFRVQVAVDKAPFKGPASAPVTIVEFTDFHCPFCKQVELTLAQLLSRYDGKVKLVHRDFPIEQLHPGARKAHEAARCVNEQGKFWAYHDALFAKSPVPPEQLRAYAREAGADPAAFDRCLSSGKYQAAVQKDIEEGVRAGVTGTPAFFINGRALTGAQPLDRFVQVIDDELARAQ